MTESESRFRRFELLRDYLKHEDGLINHRITWNLTTQGFLFAAFGLLCPKGTDPVSGFVAKLTSFMGGAPRVATEPVSAFAAKLIPFTGCAISIAATAGILAAHLSIRNLVARWKGDEGFGPGGWLPPLAGGGGGKAVAIGLLAGFGPVTFITSTWVAIVSNAIGNERPILISGIALLLQISLIAIVHWLSRPGASPADQKKGVSKWSDLLGAAVRDAAERCGTKKVRIDRIDARIDGDSHTLQVTVSEAPESE